MICSFSLIAIICSMTEPVRGMCQFLVLRHKPIWMVVSLCKHACKEVCDVKPGLDPCPLLARSWNRWWLDFITFIAYKKVKIKLKKAKCVLNRCKDLSKIISSKNVWWLQKRLNLTCSIGIRGHKALGHTHKLIVDCYFEESLFCC